MNAFATYDREASELEDPSRFWDEVEEILHVDIHNHSCLSSTSASGTATLQAHLTTFYALCDACYDTHLEQVYNSDYLLARLLESPLLSSTPSEECARVLTSLAIGATSLPTLALVYDTLLKLGARQAGIFRSSEAATQLIPRLVHHFWAARYAEEVNEKRGGAEGSTLAAAPRSGKQDVTGWSGADWNVKHVRSTSLGDPKRQMAQQRDRNLQIRLRERALELLYEICRSQRLTSAEMRPIDATFVNHLFELVEHSRNWQDDTYNYQLIKLIVALNEQFMVLGISAASSKAGARKSTASASNTVLTVLRTRLNASKTFGENVIFMLNRASSRDAEDICMQLLILKLLYLLFTTKETAHYFYTNDLKVLVDIFIRELSDLPDDHESLRHTYLRVLHPLLTNTQLLSYPYKRQQIRRLLVGLTSHGHLRDISSTTQRLVDRCLSAEWCIDLDQVDSLHAPSVSHAGPNGEHDGKHTFSVQRIAGGPTILIQTQVAVDAEGLIIPVDSDHEPIQGASKSAVELSDSFQAVVRSPDGSVDEHLTLATTSTTNTTKTDDDEPSVHPTTPKMRTTRVHSMSERPPLHFRGFLKSNVASSGYSDIASKDELTIISDGQASYGKIDEIEGHLPRAGTDLTLLPSRNGRAKSATDPPVSAPKRVHSAVDVRSTTGGGDADSESESVHWAGSPSTSWHQSMTYERSTPSAVAPQGISQSSNGSVPFSSPLRDSLTLDPYTGQAVAHFAEATQPVLAVLDAPAGPSFHVQSASGEEMQSQTTSTTELSTPRVHNSTMRRPPPAPPTSECGNGKARSTQYRKLGLHSSPSESSLSCSTSSDARLTGEATTNKQYLLATAAYLRRDSTSDGNDARSTPVSPDRSCDASRASSPLPPASGTQTPLGSTSGRRRRPPPPPIDRSTKSPQPAQNIPIEEDKMHEQGNVSALAVGKSKDQVGEMTGDERVEQNQPRTQLSSYLRHLHLSSEKGYGW